MSANADWKPVSVAVQKHLLREAGKEEIRSSYYRDGATIYGDHKVSLISVSTALSPYPGKDGHACVQSSTVRLESPMSGTNHICEEKNVLKLITSVST